MITLVKNMEFLRIKNLTQILKLKIFLNLQNYGLNLIFNNLKHNFEIRVIPKAIETYMSFTFEQPKKVSLILDFH